MNSKLEAVEKQEIPELLTKMSNAEPETDETIVAFAKTKGVALIAFIAPYVSVRVSPVDAISASIGLQEEFGVETVINELKRAKTKKAYLL
jgi:hypothetical protein